jgi:hypothetical protein
MDLKKVECEYDNGHGSDNKFSNLPKSTQEWFKARDAFFKTLENKDLTEKEMDRLTQKWQEQWDAAH